MKQPLLSLFLILIIIALNGCFKDDSNNSEACSSIIENTESDTKSFPYIEGSLTVADDVCVSNIKIGLFYRSNAEGISDRKLDFDSLKGRLYFIDRNNEGASVEILPDIRGYIYDNGTYFINLKNPPPSDSSDVYFITAWFDSDSDGMIDLVAENIASGDEGTPALSYADKGEYNRGPVKNLNGDDVYISYFNTKSGTSDYEFKYYGVDPQSGIENVETLTDTNNREFNFTISSTIDSNK